jgi:hypothetical protein
VTSPYQTVRSHSHSVAGKPAGPLKGSASRGVALALTGPEPQQERGQNAECTIYGYNRCRHSRIIAIKSEKRPVSDRVKDGGDIATAIVWLVLEHCSGGVGIGEGTARRIDAGWT